MDDVLMVASPRQLAVENEARYDEHDDRNRSGPLAVQDGEMRRGALFKSLHLSDFELVFTAFWRMDKTKPANPWKV